MISGIRDLERYKGKLIHVDSSVLGCTGNDPVVGHLAGIVELGGIKYVGIECNGDGRRPLTYHVPFSSTHSSIHQIYVDGIGWVYESNGNGRGCEPESQILLLISNNPLSS